MEKDVAAGEAESCYRSFHAAVLGLTVRYRLGIVGVTSLRGRTHCLYWDAYGTPRTRMVVPLRTIVCWGREWAGHEPVLPRSSGWRRGSPRRRTSRLWSRYSLLVASYQVWMECSQGILYVRGAEDKCAIFSE